MYNHATISRKRVDAMFEDNLKIQAVLILGIVICLLSVGFLDAQSDIHMENNYCEMVHLWESSDVLPKEQRPGWPPYKGEC